MFLKTGGSQGPPVCFGAANRIAPPATWPFQRRPEFKTFKSANPRQTRLLRQFS
jgi:hypothetical protein